MPSLINKNEGDHLTLRQTKKVGNKTRHSPTLMKTLMKSKE